MQYENISNFTGRFYFGTIQNGVFNSENDGPINLTTTSWTKTLSAPPWITGMMDHVAKLKIWDQNSNLVVDMYTDSHTIY
jgi:hypothetical protein